ncbi:MAG TPA: RNA 2'-phosphotransferase [Pyrinomonadaceae bacterium]|jgi:putative RNA 2'-phosphotransferase
MDEKRRTKISKFLSLVLRHKPEEIGLTLEENGWVPVEKLIEACADRGRKFSLAELREVVETNEKKRFSFDETGEKIRANQGHSVEVEIEFEEKAPPAALYHGTAEKNLGIIFAEGLQKMARHHVHLSADTETARAVGARYGVPVILEIDAARMLDEGFKFYVSANGVWLTDAVPSEFLKVL